MVPNEISNYVDCKYYDENEFNVMYQTVNSLISVLHVNLQSSFKNYGILCAHLQQLKIVFDVICISEAGPGNLNRCANVLGDNYHYDYRPPDSNKGGVAIYINKKLSYKLRDDLEIMDADGIENLWYEISCGPTQYVIGAMYRHPGYQTQLICDMLDRNASLLHRENKTYFLCGDFNIDLLKPEHLQSKQYIETLFTSNIIPCITLPTRITLHTATLIDNIHIYKINKHANSKIVSGNILFEISDHLPNFVLLTGHKRQDTKLTKCRIFSEKNTAKFRQEIANTDWTDVTNCRGANDSYNLFLSKYTSAFNVSFPMQTLTKKQQKNKPWISKGLLISIRHKTRLYKKYLNRPNDHNKLNYKRYRNKLTKLIRTCERDYYRRMLQENKQSVKNIWKIYGNIMNSKKNKTTQTVPKLHYEHHDVTNNVDIAKSFNRHFATIGSKLARKFPQSQDFVNYLGESCEHSIFLSPITIAELNKEIMKLNPNKSPGYDQIPPKIIKATSDLIAIPLTSVFNQSFLEATVPDALKIAKILPIHKKKATYLPDNYRPISLLSTFNKLLEKLMHKRLYSFLIHYKQLYEYQFGFRKGHSTIQALTEIIENIREEVDKGNYVIGTYLDLSKAFDTVNHQILLYKLNHYGIRGLALQWLTSYLTNRKQLTYVNAEYSEQSTVNIGVPQGSVLGPLLFLIYVNDVFRCNVNLTTRLFADDTNLFVTDTNLLRAKARMENAIDNINTWFACNQLTLNIDKTCFSIFSNKNTTDITHIEANNTQIHRVQSTKYLGVLIDDKFTWQNHIDHLCSKLIKLTHVFRAISRFIDQDMAIQLYYAFVHPHITYGIEVYGTMCKKYVKGCR